MSPAIMRFFFQKTAFPVAIHTKTGMLFGQHFDGEPPRDLTTSSEDSLETVSTKKMACLCSKIKMTEPP